MAGLVLLLGACANVEEKRIRELLVEKGFGERAAGDATVQNYVAGGDAVSFLLEPTVLALPGYEQLAILTQPQPVAIDGTILVPYVGPVPVLGLTEAELKEMVEELLQAQFTKRISVTARIVGLGKAFYVFGETLNKGRIPFPKSDFTVLEALASVGWSELANLGRVRVVRPDAQNPLIVYVNFREMVLTGNTTYNIRLRNNDILYVPPTLIGTLTRFIEKLLAPLTVVVRAMFGAASVQASYQYLFEGRVTGGFFYGF